MSHKLPSATKCILGYGLILLTAFYPLHPAWGSALIINKSTQLTQQNNIPIINIATPNNAGISHNKYRQFNINNQGMILNNATNKVTSQLAGLINANSQLRGQAADLIINEVTSNQFSYLNGKLEVAGKKAAVFIANPNGITCDGCSFINSHVVTLTTGKPIFDPQGALTALDVKRGRVIVGRGGMDALSTDYTEIISRATELNGKIKAQQLSLIQGVNKVDFQNGTITQIPSTQIPANYRKPAIAIDTKNLGGMYANQIRLVSSEAGVGVNLANIHSNQKDITITIDGKITFNGNIQSTTDLNISSKDIDVTRNKRLYAEKDITLASDNLNNYGQIIAQRNIRLFSNQLINSGDKALIQANDNLWIQKNAQGDLSHLVENRAATLKTEKGDLIIRTKRLENKNPLTLIEQKILPEEGILLINDWGLMSANNPRWLNIAFVELGLSADDDASKIPRKWFGVTQIPYDLDKQNMHFHVQKGTFKLENASQPSYIVGGNNVFINANIINNSQSDISAENDLIITGGEFNNPSLTTGQYHFFDHYQLNGEYREFGLREYPVRVYQRHNLWMDDEVYSGNISAKNNLVVNMLNNFNFDINRGGITNNDSFHEIITSQTPLTNISANNIILDVNNLIGGQNIVAENDLTIIANANIRLNQPLLQAGKNLTLNAVELIQGNIVSLIGENVSLLSKNNSIIFDNPHFSLYDENSGKYFSRIGASGINTLIAGKDITLNNLSISDADSLRISAGNNISISNHKDYMESLFFHPYPYPYLDNINLDNYNFRPKTSVASYDNLLSFINKKDITLAANNDLTLQGVSFFGIDSISISAGRDINLFSEDKISLYELIDSPVTNIVKRIDFYTNKDLLLSSGRDINLNGVNLLSKERLTLLAGRNIDLNPRAFSWHTDIDSGIINQLNIDTFVRGDKGVILAANNSITSKGSALRSQSDILLTSGGDIRLESFKSHFRRQDGNTLKEYHNQSVTDIWSRDNLTILSEGSILFQATKMEAKGAIEIAAKGGFLYAQAVEEVYNQSGKDRSCKRFLGFKSCNLFGSSTRDWTKYQVTNKVTEFTAEEDINLWARDDITLEASKIRTLNNAKITSEQGSINFRAVRDRNFEQVIGKSSGFFLTHNDTGYIADTWALPSLYIGGELSIESSHAISADIKANNRQSIDDVLTSLSNSEGSEWLAQLKDNDNVHWDQVYDAYDDWDHETKRLNPVVSAVIAIAVAAATYGSGLAASASASAVAASGTTGVPAAVVSGMASAGLAGLTSQAAVALVENEGNLSDTFKALGNSDTVKSLVSQMIIGGALNGLDIYMGWKADPSLASSSFDPTQFKIPSLTHHQWNDVARRIAAQSAIITTTHSAIHGGNFIDNFKTALTHSIANQLHADGAQYIGDSAEYLGQGGKILSHATVAGIAAEIRGGNVKGAMVGSLAAELAAASFGENIVKASEWGRVSELQAQVARAFGGIAGGVFTGKPGGVYSGAESAETTFRNNYLSHHQKILMNRELDAETNYVKKAVIYARWGLLSSSQDGALAAGFVSGVPVELYDTVVTIVGAAVNYRETLQAIKNLINSGDVLDTVYQAEKADLLQRIDKIEQAYEHAGVDGAFNAGLESGKLVTKAIGYLAAGKAATSITTKTVDRVRQLSDPKNGPPIVEIKDIYRIESDGSKTGMAWGEGVYKQGYPFEDFVGKELKLPESARLPYGFKTFDYYDIDTGQAISVKTLNTSAKSYQSPNSVNRKINQHIDKIDEFKTGGRGEFELTPNMIQIKDLHIAVPNTTSLAQWLEINKSISYAAARNITVKVTVVAGETQ
ncbi:DUF637 domain-containing protein [Moellerella wisconsensis]|uniref:two-partner secretion domain-containing protein n=1 Tax=Moellerella wisconsensis TaxID=158849 RepID=UPI0030764F7A